MEKGESSRLLVQQPTIQTQSTRPSMSTKTVTALLLAASLVVCVTAAAIYFPKSSKNNGVENESVKAMSRRSWVIALTGRKKPYSYIDEDGNLAGFDVDFYSALCKNAGQSCELVQRPGTDCGTTVDGVYIPGDALLTGEIDACGGKGITPERLQYFDFTNPYYEVFAHFFVKNGNPLNFDETNVDGKKIGFLQSTYTDENCMRKNNKTGFTMVPADGLSNALDLVNNEEVDALFAPRSNIPGIERASNLDYSCTDGDGVMVQRGSSIPSWWNPTFQKMRQSGEFQKICDASPDRHGAAVSCVR